MLEVAAGELLSAMVDAFDHAYDLGVPALHERMKARIEELRTASFQRTLTACPCCRGTELFVSEVPIGWPFGGIDPELEVLLIACRACGDIRLRARDPRRLAEVCIPSLTTKYFRAIALPARPPEPFR
jgi:hypothetical protein